MRHEPGRAALQKAHKRTDKLIPGSHPVFFCGLTNAGLGDIYVSEQ